ncbi:bifunctional diaminohydroxyphosphoribosylaminopyrimidine deaminase/5-amino-6-(5-phosphoribosylamino)uracil reductase RibD [Oceaniglobus ichthyenteri]|uniref:bifunctional diaminohydroxyphosphoribosylaminopyrimidine deaminase/5-amino-6-(5-phosphoribosylamino)uracil reductase RibD n=1 Tax=Oceaniglobus ichthyenteri TaxID=2136177 RepID=UPI000D368511|nr:bifunctional diaminohydroxyphosphoribosylaminopyrimidine deaminase/5-amino-6-(5-phosphoribosylamino)uracil reductase RibD [Oceaniglobus ichthyenteri]
MAHALSLGRRGLGQTWPNPAVGCIIVREGRVVGRGFTQKGGRPHAETVALAQAGHRAQGATAYVTLEPCAHHGQTPPCAAGLIQAGITRVVCALGDPDPRVAGAGFAMLRAAGVEVITDVMQDVALRDQAGFLSRINNLRPMLTLKLASSFDGRIATSQGESRWITGPLARRAVHGMRLTHDAVLIGAGTARADDPMLDVRGLGQVAQPVRVVMSESLNLPLDGRLARTANQVPVWLIHGPNADPAPWQAIGARTFALADFTPKAAMQAMAEAELTRVFCEGGGSLAASLLRAGMVDRLIGFTAGLALGAEGRPSVGGLGLNRLPEGPRFLLERVTPVGGDVLAEWASAP